MNRSVSPLNRKADQSSSATPSPLHDADVRCRELEEEVTKLRRDHAELHAALFEAAQVHRKLCAPRRLRYGSFSIASEIFAVRQLPGDFFVAREMTQGLMLSLGDICGKGLAAGMWVTHLAGLLAMHTAADLEAKAVVAAVHKAFRQTPTMPLTSLFQAKLDLASGRLDYCNAGHPPALLLRAAGGIEELSDGGPLLGALPFDSFTQNSTQLESGDALVICSDGILDSTDTSGEQFGPHRLAELLRHAQSQAADALLLSLLGAVQDYAGGYPIQDDMSVVVIRREAV
jgi:sigma-B regulation protein RsbU (phosphoserine phosphatase)